MNEVKIFNHPSFGEIRTAGTPDEPMFCLNDICKALDLTNPSVVKQRLNEKGVSTTYTPTAGGLQPITYINESNLYKCIFQSRKEEAEIFQEWVTSEVLPSIRRTGGYIQASMEDTPEEIMAKALKIADRTMKDQQQRIQMLEGENDHLYMENERLAPKAQYTDEVLQSDTTYTFTQVAKELNFRSVGAFTTWLLAKRIAFRQSGVWMLTSKYAGKGYTTSRTYRYYRSDGTPATSTSTVWTETGRMFLHSIDTNGNNIIN